MTAYRTPLGLAYRYCTCPGCRSPLQRAICLGLTENETIDKEAWFFTTAYREETDNEWLLYRDFNLERDPDTNINLIRNYPDFRRRTSVILEN
jgi:hypothetical protein